MIEYRSSVWGFDVAGGGSQRSARLVFPSAVLTCFIAVSLLKFNGLSLYNLSIDAISCGLLSIRGLICSNIEFVSAAIPIVPPMLWLFIPMWVVQTILLLCLPFTAILPQLLAGKLSWPNAEDVPDEWIIHGRKYNLKSFYSKHPGGSFALRAARGSDCTGLFESYHVFIDREVLMKMLKPYEIKGAVEVEKPNVVYSDPFYEDLKSMVRDHFKGKRRSARKMTWTWMGMSFLAWASMWACLYYLVSREALWVAPFIGLLAWTCTGTFMHDGSHSAAVSQPWANRFMSQLAWPFGVNVSGWQVQHVMSHHIHTNEEEDVDLFHFEPLMEYSKGFGGKISWLVYALWLFISMATTIPHLQVIVPFQLLIGLVDDFRGNRMYDRVKAIDAHRAELKWTMLAEVSSHFVGFFLVVAYNGSFWKSVFIYWACNTCSSYCFFFFTQGNHYQAECFQDPSELEKLSFAQRQVGSSVDYAVDSAFWGFLSGGLNTQALHHCIPSVSQAHYRDLYPKFQQICKEHNVRLKVAPSMSQFLWGYISHTKGCNPYRNS